MTRPFGQKAVPSPHQNSRLHCIAQEIWAFLRVASMKQSSAQRKVPHSCPDYGTNKPDGCCPQLFHKTLGGITFIHSFHCMCRIRRFLAVLRIFFHSSLLCTFSCYPSPPTILPYSLTSSCHLFLGLPLNIVVPKFIYNTFWEFYFLPFSTFGGCVRKIDHD